MKPWKISNIEIDNQLDLQLKELFYQYAIGLKNITDGVLTGKLITEININQSITYKFIITGFGINNLSLFDIEFNPGGKLYSVYANLGHTALTNSCSKDSIEECIDKIISSDQMGLQIGHLVRVANIKRKNHIDDPI